MAPSLRPPASALALVGLVFAACSSVEVDAPDVDFEVIEEVTFAPSLGIDLTQMTKLPSGVYIQDIEVGTGAELGTGDRGFFRYSGWLRNGVLFDTGQGNLTVGQNTVIPGVEFGMIGMQVGGTRLIIVPPELGYGAAIIGAIPPGSVLVFEIELTEIQ